VTLRAYLAGPDIFVPHARQWAESKKAVCARHGLLGVSPLDPFDEASDWAALPEWRRIAVRNEAHIRSCDLLIANLTPFRGPSADVGTVYEIGFMRALGRPVFGYATTATPFPQRTLRFIGRPAGSLRDAEGMLIEQFGLFDNLMIEAAILASGGMLVLEDIAPEHRWTDLSVFERCVRVALSNMGQQAPTRPQSRTRPATTPSERAE
jgi:nucleoside 2-deoxyribosyltransferase